MDPVVPSQNANQPQPAPLQATPAPAATTPQPSPGLPASTIVANPKGPKTLVIVVLALLLLLGGGGFAFALYTGKISLPFLSKPLSLDEVGETLATMRSARIGIELTAKAEDRAAGVQPVSLEKLTATPKPEGEEEEPFKIDYTSAVLNAFPSDANVSLSTSTNWSVADETTADVETTLSGSFSSNGLTIEFDGAARVLDGTTYLMVNKLPLPIIDFSKVSGRWIKVPSSSSLTSVMGGGGDDEVRVFAPKKDADGEAEESKKKAGSFNEMRVLFAELVKDGAVSVKATDPEAEVNGAKAWKLDLAFDPAKYRATFLRVHDARMGFFPGAEEFSLFTEESAARMRNADAAAQFDALTAGMTLTAFVDKKSRLPSRIEIRIPVALSDEDAPKLAGKQVTLGTTVSLSDVDKPVVLQAPADALTMTQAQNIIMGRSEDAARYELQTDIVSDLRKALDAYHEQFKEYPASLSKLVGLEYDAMADFETMRGEYVEVVVGIPNDQYAGAPFEYAVTPDGYSLTYTLGAAPKDDDGLGSMFAPSFVEGKNTMTQDALSVEAEAAANKDSDDDGLSDTAELRLGTSPTKADTDGDGLSDGDEDSRHGTSPKKADTDGDGFSDGDEVSRGFDPLENATTKEKAEGTELFLE